MSNYNSLKTTIDANIKQNGRQEITGQILNSVLNQMVTTLGTGYQFAGVATIDTNPGTPDAKVFYIANGKGTYTKFGSLEVTEDEVVVLYWDSSWHKVSTGIASNEKLTELESEMGYKNIDVSVQGNNLPESPIYVIGGSSVYGIFIHSEDFKVVVNSGNADNWRLRVFYSDGTIKYATLKANSYALSGLLIEGISIYMVNGVSTLENLNADILFNNSFRIDKKIDNVNDALKSDIDKLEKETNDRFSHVNADLDKLKKQWILQDSSEGKYALVPGQVSGYVGNRIKGGKLLAASSPKALTTLAIPIDKSKRYKLKSKIGKMFDGVAYYENNDDTGFLGSDVFNVPSGESVESVEKEEELTIPNNANYMRLATSDSSIFELYIWNDDFKDFAEQEDIQVLEQGIRGNADEIDALKDTIINSGTPIDNVVHYIPYRILYLGGNVLNVAGASYDSGFWSLGNGMPVYLGGGGNNTPFVFDGVSLPSGNRYLCEIITKTEDDAYEGLFFIQIGNGHLIDTYNGGRTTFGGCVSDGGSFKIIPYGTKAFTIESITLKQCLESEVSDGYESTKKLEVHVVNSGNSERTAIDAKWNVAVGPTGYTMASNINGSRSVAIGYRAMQNWQNGLQNIGIGSFALSLLESGNRNVAIGSDALWQAKKAQDNVAIGQRALSKTGEHTEVSNNVCIGTMAAGSNRPDSNNTVSIGYRANVYGVKESVFIGSESTTTQVNSGISHAIAIGYLTRATKDNQILIGHRVEGTKENQVRIGNADNDEFILGNKKLIFNSDRTITWEDL